MRKRKQPITDRLNLTKHCCSCFKVAPYSFMTERKLVTNLAGNSLIIGEKYDVTCVKMPNNERKYLAFPSVNFFEGLCSARQRLYLSNSIFSKISIEIGNFDFREGNSRNCRKKRKNKKRHDIFNSLLPWQRSSEDK